MKRLLAIDTSTWWVGVALLEQASSGAAPVVVAERVERVDDSHAARLLGRVEALLSAAGWSTTELDAFVAVRGPGSFTGIRVALGTVRGLALATDRPAVGITSLEAIAESHGPASRDRLTLLEAGRGQIFGALYDATGSPPVELRPPWLGTLSSPPRAPVVILYPPQNEEAARRTASLAEAAELVPVSRGIAAAAGRLALLHGLPRDVQELSMSPLYLRPPDAEVNKRSR